MDRRRSPIEEATASGLRTADASYPLDVIIFATGFDAITGALSRIDLRGRRGAPLGAQWSDGPSAYLGVATAGFPNLFMVNGPASPSVLSNMVVPLEQRVEWIADCLAHLYETGRDEIEVDAEAERAWLAHVQAVAGDTLYPTADSWYTGANISGKTRSFRIYVGGVGTFRQIAANCAASDYPGFVTRQPGLPSRSLAS